MTKTIYIAGPMSGYPNWNYDAFNRTAYTLRRQGWNVKNPAEKDVESGFVDKVAMVNGDTDLAAANGNFDFREAYLWDVTQIIKGDAIFMLKGWERSPGAIGEHAVAVAMQKNYPEFQIIYE